MMRYISLILFSVMLCNQSSYAQKSDKNINQSRSTAMAINFNLSGPNRFVTPENFFTTHCGTGHGIDLSLMHIPQKFLGFYGNVFYNYHKFNESSYYHNKTEYRYVLRGPAPRPAYQTSGVMLGIAGLFDPTKNGILLFTAKTGVGFCKTIYPNFAIVDNQGNAPINFNYNTKTTMKHVALNLMIKLEDNVYFNTGYDLKWTNKSLDYNQANIFFESEKYISIGSLQLGIFALFK